VINGFEGMEQWEESAPDDKNTIQKKCVGTNVTKQKTEKAVHFASH